MSPVELLLGRRPRLQLDLIHPNLEQQVQTKQICQKANRGGRTAKSLITGSPVFAKNFVSGQKWLSSDPMVQGHI